MSPTFDPSERLRYDSVQIQAYLEAISLPSRYRESPVFKEPSLAHMIEHGLPLLAALQKYQLAAIPFENLTLHYNPEHSVTIQPAFVHQKFITSACGRGGRCMENNLMFYTVLLSLGYNVTSIAGRVNEAVQPASGRPDWPGPTYDAWNHRITLVHFSIDQASVTQRTFLVDTGFGATCPNQPMELRKDSPSRRMNVPPGQESRICWTTIPDVVNKGQKMWVYEIRFKSDAEWTPAYCFGETEFLPNDYRTMSFFTSTSPASWFTFSIVCVKMLLGKAEDTDEDIIIGDVTLFDNEVKRRIYGKAETVEKLETESQRVAALRKWFGIILSPAEQEAIKGTKTALL